jgi:hypothetical protein
VKIPGETFSIKERKLRTQDITFHKYYILKKLEYIFGILGHHRSVRSPGLVVAPSGGEKGRTCLFKPTMWEAFFNAVKVKPADSRVENLLNCSVYVYFL